CILHQCNAAIVKIFLQNGAKIFLKNKFGETLLHSCCINWVNGVEIAKLLFENGARVLLEDQDSRLGFTPLHMAAFYGNLELVKLFIQNGANLYLSDNFGRLPVYVALEQRKFEIFKYIKSKMKFCSDNSTIDTKEFQRDE